MGYGRRSARAGNRRRQLESAHLIEVLDVELDAVDLGPGVGGLEGGLDLLELGDPPGNEDDLCAGLHHPVRDGLAYAGARARDQADLSGEVLGPVRSHVVVVVVVLLPMSLRIRVAGRCPCALKH